MSEVVDQNEELTLELTVVQTSTTTTVKSVKRKRTSKVKQENIGEEELSKAKPRKARKRKDKSIRALFWEKMASLSIEQLKKPWMASKSFRLLDTEEKLAAWVDEVLADKSRWQQPYENAPACPIVAVDTETTGLDTRILTHKRELRNEDGSFQLDEKGRHIWEFTYEVKVDTAGVCLSTDGVSGVYIPLLHEKCANVSKAAVRYHLQRLFNVSHLVFYNAKFDREICRLTLGIGFREYPHFEDIQVLHYINDPKAQLDDDDTFSQTAGGLKELSREKLGIDQIDLETIGKVDADWCPVTNSGYCFCTEDERREKKHGKRKQYVPFGWIPTSIALWYAAADAICTWLLWDRMRKEAQSRIRVHKIDGELIDSLTWMERQRFYIDEAPHTRLRNWHLRTMTERRLKLREIANRMGWIERSDDEGNVIPETQFDVDKKHLPKLLFDIMKLEVVKKSEKTGAPSVDKEAMVDLIKKYPNNEFLLALKEYKQYVALHPENLRYDPHDHTARIYLKQAVVAGGRLAASGGQFDRDGGFGLNAQAIKKVGGNHFVRGKVLSPDYVLPEDVQMYEESDLHSSCFKDYEESLLVGWRQSGTDEVFAQQYPDDLGAVERFEDEWNDVTLRDKYPQDAPERSREAVYEKRKVRKRVPGIINNHIANFLGYSVCLVPKCTSCAEKFGILIEDGKLDANQVLNLRALFVAQEGWTFISSDYSNIEMRCAANCSLEPEFIKEFLEGLGDFHSLTASKVFPAFTDPNSSKAERKACRDLAKIINFALLYGGTQFTIFENMRKLKPEITMKDTEAMVNAYWEGVPVFKAWCQELQRIAREEMRCTTATGRVIKFDTQMEGEGITVPTSEEWQEYWNYVRVRKRQREADEGAKREEKAGNIALAAQFSEEAANLKKIMDDAYFDKNSGVRNAQDYNRFMSKIQRVAVNVPLQGLAGDFMRMALNRVRKWATQREPLVQSVMRMHGSVHDELDYTVKNPYLPFVVPRVTRLMKLRKLHELRNWPVGIECDTEYGRSWDVQFHLTGDADHIPAGWTGIKGLEEYLPEECTMQTVEHLMRGLASGDEKKREKVLAWVKANLHPHAAEAFWHAAFFNDKEKKAQVLTDGAIMRRQIIAALQLHEYWSIDAVADDQEDGMESLEEYEARCGLTQEDRGFMPPGGFLGTLADVQVRYPNVPTLGDRPVTEEEEPGATLDLFSPAPDEQPVVVTESAVEPVPVAALPEKEFAAVPMPPPTETRDASEMASDTDLIDELLYGDTGGRLTPARRSPAASTSRLSRRNVPPVPVQAAAPMPENVFVLREMSLAAFKEFSKQVGKGFGTCRISFRYVGASEVRTWGDCMSDKIPPQFLEEVIHG